MPPEEWVDLRSLSLYAIRVPRTYAFEITRGESSNVEQVVVAVEGGRETGWGAGSANSVTGEDLTSIENDLRMAWPHLAGRKASPAEVDRDIMRLLEGSSAAGCALSLAVWDLAGRVRGENIADMLGLRRRDILCDMSIGLCDTETALMRGRWAVEKGFRALKVKVGRGAAEDAERVLALRDAFPGVRFWGDGNQGYTAQDVERFVEMVGGSSFEFIEEPCPTLEEAQCIRDRMELMADESAMNAGNIERICAQALADMVNIKLMKCGSLSEAHRSAEVMQRYGVPGMVGCMGETSLSLAGGLAVAFAASSMVVADLDSAFMLSGDICTGLVFRDGSYRYTGRPGLGVDVSEDRLLRFCVRRVDLPRGGT